MARSLHLSTLFGEARLIGTDTCENLYGIREGLFHKIYRVPLWNRAEYMPVLRNVCEKERIGHAIVIPEPEVLVWSESTAPVPVLLPPPKLGRIALSKSALFDALADSGVAPSYRVCAREEFLEGRADTIETFPCWMRDCSPGATSAKAALKVTGPAEATAWALLHKDVAEFMVSEYLPGRNFACCMLFQDDELLKFACAERMKYFGGHLFLSGISGNTSQGRLINDGRVHATAERCVRLIARKTGESLNGLLTVDMRENGDGTPLVTEVNLRHVAFTSAFAAGGANMAEAQLLATMGLGDRVDRKEVRFPPGNLFLRDIDGLPLWVENWQDPAPGPAL